MPAYQNKIQKPFQFFSCISMETRRLSRWKDFSFLINPPCWAFNATNWWGKAVSRQCLQLLFTSLDQDFSKLNNNKADLLPACTVAFSSALLTRRCLIEAREPKPMSELVYKCWKFSRKTSSAILSLPQNMQRERPLVPETQSVPWNTQPLTSMDLGDSFSQFNRAIAQPRDAL